MNPHSNCTPTKNQTKKALNLYQAQRRANPVRRSLDQSSDTVRRHNARTNQAVQVHESEQRAAARDVPGVRGQEQSANTVRQAIARDEPGSKGPKSSRTDCTQKRRSFQVNSILSFCHNDKHESQHVGQLISIKGHII